MFDGYFPVCLANRDGDARQLWELTTPQWLKDVAKAIEAGTAKTAGLGPNDESAVGEADLPKQH